MSPSIMPGHTQVGVGGVEVLLIPGGRAWGGGGCRLSDP